ncbi:hypothetical protein ACFBZI_11370 [Moraxella sp. ZJ142]|uniref:hypothetical protein n=1 Tax=Moraxella marmotae TaxID=3344520 RepID=UPI0035D447BD
MNKIFKTKRNSRGQSVVCSEIAKSSTKGRIIASALAVAVVGLMNTAHAEEVAILGTATGTNAVAVGDDSYATSTSGIATGFGAVATGTNIDRTSFDKLAQANKTALDAYNKAADALKNANNTIAAQNTAIDGLAKEIDALAKQSAANAVKLAEKEKLDNQKAGLQPRYDEAKKTLDGVSVNGKNLYLNFTDVLNSLNWTPLTNNQNSDAARNTVSAELKQTIERNFADFAGKYTDADYRNIVDGYINRQASYQGTYEYLENALTDQNRLAPFNPFTLKDLYNNGFFNTTKDTAAYAVLDGNHNSNLALDTDRAYQLNPEAFGKEYIVRDGDSTRLEKYGMLRDARREGGSNFSGVPQSFLNAKVLHQASYESLKKTDQYNPITYMYTAPRLDGSFNSRFSVLVDGKNFSTFYNTEVFKKSIWRFNEFGLKPTNGNNPIGSLLYDRSVGVVTKINDYTVNNNNLISSEDIKSFKNHYKEINDLYTKIDWNFDKSPIDLKAYRASLDKIRDYNSKINNALDIYQNIIDEAKKPDANRSKIDTMTVQLMNLKQEIITEAYNPENWFAGMKLVYDKKNVDYYYSFGKPLADEMIRRINSELKLYNDKDQLIVEATTKAKEAQKAHDDLKAQLDDINKKIKDLNIPADAAAVNDLKREKEAEKARLEGEKAAIEADLANKQKAADDAQKALKASELGNKGLRNQAHGHMAFASGNDAIAMGTNATVIGNDSIGIGSNALVTGTNSIAIGKDNVVASNNAAVFGNNISVPTGFDNTVVLGNDSMPTKANPTANITIQDTVRNFAGANPTATVSVGKAGAERQITNVAAGRVTASSTDAVNGSQLYAVVEAVNNIKLPKTPDAPKAAGIKAGDGLAVTAPTDGDNNYTISLAPKQAKDISDALAASAQEESVSAGSDAVTVKQDKVNETGGKNFAVDLSDATKSKLADAGKKTSVGAGDGVVVNMAGKNATGGDIYNVSLSDATKAQIAKETTAKAGSDKVTVKEGANSTGGKEYTFDLSDTAKADIAKQASTKAGSDKVVVKDGVNSTGGKEYSVDLSDAAKAQLAKEESVKAGSNTVTVKEGTNATGGKEYSVDLSDTVKAQLADAGKKTSVAGGNGVTVKVTGKNATGGDIYTVSLDDAAKAQLAKETTAKAGSDSVSVTESDNATGGKEYTFDLSDKAKAQLAKEESVSAGSDAVTVKQDKTNATGGNNYSVDLSAKTKAEIAKKTSVTGKDGVIATVAGKNATGGDIYAVGLTADTQAEIAKKTSVGQGDGITVTDGGKNATGGNIYNVALSDKTKADIAKQTSVAGDDDVKVTKSGKNSTGGDTYTVGLTDKAKADIAKKTSVTGKDGVIATVAGKNATGGDIYAIGLDAKTKADIAKQASTKAGSDQITVKEATNATGGKEYSVDLSDKAKARLAKEESVSAGSTAVVVKQDMDNATGGKNFSVDLSAETKADIAKQATTKAGSADVVVKESMNSTGGKEYTVDLADTTKADIAKQASVSAGSPNVVITPTMNASGGVDYAVDVAKQLDLGPQGAVKTGDVVVYAGGLHNGGNRITGVAPGMAGTDAVNLDQLYGVQSQLQSNINAVSNELKAGIAASSAFVEAPTVAGKWTYAAGASNYANHQAVAVMLRKTADNGRWSFTGGVSSATKKGETIVRLGVSGVF